MGPDLIERAGWMGVDLGSDGRSRLKIGAARSGRRGGGDRAAPTLSPGEREVIGRLALGQTNREIAEALFITEKTASVHVSHILMKCDARNRSEAAALAQRLGLVAEPDPHR